MMITAFKCTRANATDFRTGAVAYVVGQELVHPDPDTTHSNACGRGYHVSPTAKKTCQFGDRSRDRGKWRWFEVHFNEADILGRDDEKFRVLRLNVVREVFVEEVFGAKLAENVAKQRAEVASWKAISWVAPSAAVGEADLAPLCAQMHDATKFWLAKRGLNRDIPRAARIITDRTVAIETAQRARNEWHAAAAAAADAADAAAAAAAGAAADDAAAAVFRPSWLWWYLRPYYVLWRHSRFILAGMTEPNPFAPIVAMYRLGVLPLGWVGGEFCIYVPAVVAAAKAA